MLVGCAGTSRHDVSHPRSSADQTQPKHTYSINDRANFPASLTLHMYNHRGYLLAPARIDGQTAGMFMFDTGSSLAVVSTGVAGRLGLPSNGSGNAIGVGGRQGYQFRSFRSLEFGGLEVKADRAAAISMHDMSRSIGASITGLIGIRQLNNFPFTLDYGNNTLTVYRPDAFTPPPGVKPTAARFDLAGLPVVDADLGNGRRVWLILDSGADNELTLPRKCLMLWPDIVSIPGSGEGRSAGVGGAVASTQTWIKTLDLFGLQLRDMPVQFEKAPDVFNRQPRPIGRIGGAFLKNFRLTMDPRRRMIWAEWLPGEKDAGNREQGSGD